VENAWVTLLVALIAGVPATIAAVVGTKGLRLRRLEVKTDVGTLGPHFHTRLRSVQWASSRPMWETDADGKVVWCNEAYMSLQGTGLAHTIGEPWVPGNVDPIDSQRLLQTWAKAVQNETEFAIICRYNKQGWWSLDAVLIRDVKGHVLGWVGAAIPLNGTPTKLPPLGFP